MSTETTPETPSSSPAPVPPLNEAAAQGGLTPAFPTPEHNQSNDPNMVIGGPKPIAEQHDPADAPPAPAPIAPVETLGVPSFDRSSQRETEVFSASDVVFVREGATTHLTAYPKHEAETRFSKITDRKSRFDTPTGKTTTNIALESGENVTIDGTTVTVTPAEGEAKIDGPSLNAHAPNEAH